MKDFRSFLLDGRVVEPELLERICRSDTAESEPLYYRLLRERPELEERIWRALAEFLDVELIDPASVSVDPGLIELVPARLAHRHCIVPICRRGNRLEVAMADPRQFAKSDELAVLLSRRENGTALTGGSLTVLGRLARPSDIAGLIRSVYGIGAETVADALDIESATVLSVLGPEVVDLTADSQESGQDAAIIRFVNQLLLEAVKIGASDIHLEPFEDEFKVRYRVDGMLQSEPVPARLKHLESAIISRIKIMARLDIAEKRLPQDGQIRLMVMGRAIDVRLSVLPTMFGQGLVLRLLDRQVAFRSLDNLGISADYLDLYRSVLHLSHGVILVTGPTGSGKTTTLYASLSEISREDRKVITVEDPIEYQLAGVSQVQVRPEIDLTFANVLRNILRHDPDIIMVGEIRDRTTAQIAISAAMTGHLVFSTLHTNDAASAPVRLLDMGLEPYLVSSALEAVIAQRLIRLLCVNCRRPSSPQEAIDPEVRQVLGDVCLYRRDGCPECRDSGYRGRTAIFEMFTLNDRIRELIVNRSGASQIRAEAIGLGMRTLYDNGLDKVRDGLSSLAEVYRVARDETIDMRSHMSRNLPEDDSL